MGEVVWERGVCVKSGVVWSERLGNGYGNTKGGWSFGDCGHEDGCLYSSANLYMGHGLVGLRLCQ